MTVNKQETVFEEKFRPKTVEDIILPQELKTKVQSWIDDENLPNLLLTSRAPGLGKTSLTHVLINEFETDAIFINISF